MSTHSIVHVRCRGHLRGGQLLDPFAVLRRLAHSVAINTIELGEAFNALLDVFDAADELYKARVGPVRERPDVPAAAVLARADVGSVALARPAFDWLVDLVRGASRPGAFGAALPPLAGLECVVLAPVLRDLVTPLDAPVAPPPVEPLRPLERPRPPPGAPPHGGAGPDAEGAPPPSAGPPPEAVETLPPPPAGRATLDTIDAGAEPPAAPPVVPAQPPQVPP